MGYRPTKTALRKLLSLAQGQGGYFTAKQAAEVGYNYPHLDYHLRAKNFERAGHGIYRLPEIPTNEHDDLIRLSFWSRDRSDLTQAVASHHTALALHSLSDLLPSKIHVTVPTTFRKKAPKGVVLHRMSLAKNDTEEREGFKVTTPLRTLIDASLDQTLSEEHLAEAVKEALERGLVRKPALASVAKTLPAKNRLSTVLASLA